MLIFENPGAFSVAKQVLADMVQPPYGAVACGEGARFERSVQYISTLRRRFLRIEYVGDLDDEGMRIAVAATAKASRSGLPPIVPAAGVHEAMLKASAAFGYPLGWPNANCGVRRGGISEFLPGSVAAQVREILAANRRIPEEVLGPEELSALWARSQNG
jgi:hypothetical protein